MKVVRTPFQIEERRAELALRKDYFRLKQQYGSELPEIPNKNDPELWDMLNKREDLLSEDNYMERDKLTWVSQRITRNKSLLNIGFGSGNLEELNINQKEMTRWVGIDISEESVNAVQKKYKQGIFSVMRVENLKFHNMKFDYIVALEVLEHISPKKILSVLKSIHTHMDTNGQLIISVPLNENLEEMVRVGVNPNEHVRVYTPSLIEAELVMSGFRVVERKYIYAFKKYYTLKSLIMKLTFQKLKNPNGIVIIAQKDL